MCSLLLSGKSIAHVQVSLSLISQTFILLSILEPLYNNGFRPLFDALKQQDISDESLLIISALQDTVASLLLGVPGIDKPSKTVPCIHYTQISNTSRMPGFFIWCMHVFDGYTSISAIVATAPFLAVFMCSFLLLHMVGSIR